MKLANKCRCGNPTQKCVDELEKLVEEAEDRANELTRRIQHALNVAGDRWSEWGERAEQVENILKGNLTE
jgi:hypothetical protein